MLLNIFDKNFNRLTNISVYSFATYTEEYNELGSFEVQTILDSDGRTAIQQGYYLLLEKDVCGIIQSVNPEIDEETQESKLVIKGYLVKQLLTRRCIPKSLSFNGTTVAFVNKIVEDNCVNPSDTSRQLPIVLDSVVPSVSDSQQRQVTGGDVEERIAELLDAQELGHNLTPVLTPTSISGFKFTQLKGADRTIGNTDNNAPVVFSTDLKNVLSGKYTYNSQDLKNTAYVAGEGEGTARVVRIVNDSNSGVDRYELYVDARDLQSTDENGNTLTTAQYNTALDNRGLEQLKEYIISETYEATIDLTSDKYTYKQDFFVGDLVTVRDKSIGIELDVRITAVQISDTIEELKCDVTFGRAKMRIGEKLKRRGVI